MSHEIVVSAEILIDALRQMRKWGFTVVQDRHGRAQSEDAQLVRAEAIAACMLGQEAGSDAQDVRHLARAILDVAEAADRLDQFR